MSLIHWVEAMRMLSLSPRLDAAEVPSHAIVCHDVRNPLQRSEILARKGADVSADALRQLLDRGVLEIHLALPEPGDVAEDDAATQMAAAIAGPGVRVEAAHFGQSSLISAERGMLRVAGASLDRANALDGVLLLTGEPHRPVDAGTTLGVVKCAPLFLSESTLSSVDSIVRTHGPIVEVEPFQTRRVALVAPAERLRGGAFERARAALADAVGWYGSTLDHVVGAEATVEALSDAYTEVQDGGADLVLAAGASGTDPLDVVFEGLRDAGGEVLQLGIPAEPGTACWIGRLGAMPVLGLASCELFGQPGALDLLLPRLLTGEALDQDLLRHLALGGLLLGPSRIAPYHTPHAAAT
jgi:molybdenum cofactor cytidylyltransferase